MAAMENFIVMAFWVGRLAIEAPGGAEIVDEVVPCGFGGVSLSLELSLVG